MQRVDQYRQNAKEAIETAQAATNLKVREQWIRIAAEWTALAKARLELVVQDALKTDV